MDEDDDWLEAGPSNQGSSADPLVEQEYQRIATRYSDAGYREGITDGKLTTLQQGFDSSFAASVPPSRRLGQLRGQANALLAYLTRSAPSTARSTPGTTSGSGVSHPLVDSARELVQDLARIKRVKILPKDLERERHEQEEHGGDDTFELDHTEKREMEGLEDALGSVGANGQKTQTRQDEVREGELLDQLQNRLDELKVKMRS